MTNNKEFQLELKALLDKHKVVKFSMCYELEGKFHGGINIGDGFNNLGNYYESGLLVARLYQSARKNIIDSINEMEGD